MNESIVQLNQMEYIPAFESRIEEHFQYTEDNMDVLQINVGKLCNLSCKHCHVEAGPNRKEIMERDAVSYTHLFPAACRYRNFHPCTA